MTLLFYLGLALIVAIAVLLFLLWRNVKRAFTGRVDLTAIVAETLRNPDTQRRIAENVMQHNVLFQRLCVHDWHVEEGQDLMTITGIPWFVCSKCGKRENTI